MALSTGMVAQMAIGAIVPLLPTYATQVGLSASGVGLIIAMPSAARLVLNLPLGFLVDAIGRKPPLVIGTLVEALGSIGTACASSLLTMCPPRLLVGAGSSAAGTANAAYTMDVVGKFPEHKGLLLGTAQAAMLLAFAAGPALGGLIAETWGSAAFPFYIIAGVLVGSAPLFALLPETRKASTAATAGFPGALNTALSSFAALLARPEQQALLALRFGLITGWSAWLTVLPLHATAMWGATPGQLGQMYSLIALLGLVSAPIGGVLADRIGRTPIVAAGSALSALALGALPWASSKASFYACMGVWDVGEAMLTAAATALAADVTEEASRGAQTSLGNQVQDATFVVMPVLLGAIANAHSNSAALLVTAGAMVLSNAVFALRMRKL